MVYIWLMMVNNLVSGFNPSAKYELISWGDEIPNIWKNKNMFQTTNQPYDSGDDQLQLNQFFGCSVWDMTNLQYDIYIYR